MRGWLGVLLCVVALAARATAFTLELDAGTPPVRVLGAEETWNDPSVLVHGNGTMHMWATHTKTFPWGFPVEPYHLTSTDGGVTWAAGSAPVLEVGAAGTFDHYAVETPSVAYFSGAYHMYYTAEPEEDPTEWSIGHASSPSPDGPWTRTAAPVITNADGGCLVLAEPGVIEWDGKLWVFYTCVVTTSQPAPLHIRYRVGVASSTDGVHFAGHRVAFEQSEDSHFPFNSTGPWIGFSTPAPVRVGAALVVFYGVYRTGYDEAAGCYPMEVTQSAVSYATAAAPDAPFDATAGAIFQRGDFDWTVCEVRAANAVVDADGGKLSFFFAGETLISEVNFGVGMARMDIIDDDDDDDDESSTAHKATPLLLWSLLAMLGLFVLV